MTNKPSLPPGERWLVTEKGSLDLRCAETCVCEPKIFGLLVKCIHCETVYGQMRDPRDRRFRDRRLV